MSKTKRRAANKRGGGANERSAGKSAQQRSAGKSAERRSADESAKKKVRGGETKHRERKLRTVGHNVARAEGLEKVTGAARYIDDLSFDDMLYGATVRSTIPAGRIVAVDRDPSFDWSGFTFVDHRDIVAPGKNVVAMISDDQPFLAGDRVRHQAEPIALIAHADRARLAEALAHVTVRYQPEPAQLDFESASTVLKEIAIRRGDIDAVFARPGVTVVEGTYRTGA
jgi:xanthine dehydrogenase molybdopterin-binding subunit B